MAEQTATEPQLDGAERPETMRAAVFRGRERIALEEHSVPVCGPNDAIVRVALTP